MKTKSISNIEAFNLQFQSQDDCLRFLSGIKWKNGFQCRRCGFGRYIKGRVALDRRCVRCYYNESPTARTIFHHIKFPLLKAFYICFRMSVSKKGVSSLELSRELGLRQKTCWAFRRKVQQAMAASTEKILQGFTLGKLFQLGLRRPAKNLKQEKYKKYGILIMERPSRDKSSRVCIKIDSKTRIQSFIATKSSSHYVSVPEKSRGQKDSSHRILNLMVFNLKNWFKGIHHVASTTHAQCYMNEFCFRFNGRSHIPELFGVLLKWMMETPPLIISKGEHGA